MPDIDREWLTDEEIHQCQIIEHRKRGTDTPPLQSLHRRDKRENNSSILPSNNKSYPKNDTFFISIQ